MSGKVPKHPRKKHEPKPEFKEDWRKNNPGLHLLYVKWAVKHLRLIDLILRRLFSEHNLNLWDTIAAVETERNKLIKEKAAYADADEILKSLKRKPKL